MKSLKTRGKASDLIPATPFVAPTMPLPTETLPSVLRPQGVAFKGEL
jgi:hypothetical protein